MRIGRSTEWLQRGSIPRPCTMGEDPPVIADWKELQMATEITMEEFKFADTVCELAGSTRTRAADLNLGRWNMQGGGIAFWVSLTADGREFRIFKFDTREAALDWARETCGEIRWTSMEGEQK